MHCITTTIIHILISLFFYFFSPIWDDDDELIESECKQCGQIYTPDQRLPDWMSRASCQNCLIWSSDNAGAKHKVVHCHYCRQGKYGWVKCSKNRSISICLNCVDRTKAYIKMSQESHVQTYVKGMLNELVSTEYNDYLTKIRKKKLQFSDLPCCFPPNSKLNLACDTQ